jgi:hypothetical protein
VLLHKIQALKNDMDECVSVYESVSEKERDDLEDGNSIMCEIKLCGFGNKSSAYYHRIMHRSWEFVWR